MKKPLSIIASVILLGLIGYWGTAMLPFAKGVKDDVHKNNIHLLSESRLENIALTNLNGNNISTELQSEFPNSNIEKELGQQDGPDFVLYSLSTDNKEILYTSMLPEDSTVLNSITFLSPNIKDIYGQTVGTAAQQIIESRSNINFYADVHQNIYAKAENSNIEYRLRGNLKELNDGTYFSEDHTIEKSQVYDMFVEHIIWHKKSNNRHDKIYK